MQASESLIGIEIGEIPTPALILNLNHLDYNIDYLADYFKDKPCSLRPHVKTHKCLTISHLQIEKGAIGVSCAKLGEAEVMAQGGIKNILISNEVVGLKKLQLLAGLARYCNMIVAVDNFKNSSNISKAAKKIGVNIGALVDLDVGLKRCGVRQVDDAVELAKHVSTLSNVDFKGIMAYEGSMRGKTHEEKKRLAKISMAKAIESRDLIEAAGIPVEIVSAGGTATYDSTGLYSGVTEIQPGSYVLMETPYINEGLPFKPALTILATVISKSTDKLVLNVGRKGITRDQGMPELKDFPNSVINLHEEHCLVDMDEDVKSLDICDKIQLLPSHCCTTVNLYEFYHCVRNGRVEAIWDIHARGKVR